MALPALLAGAAPLLTRSLQPFVRSLAGKGLRFMGGGPGRATTAIARNPVARLTGGGLAFGVGMELADPLLPGRSTPRDLRGKGEGGPSELIAAQGGVITKTWQPHEASPPFFRIDYPGTNRRPTMVVQRKDGSMKTYKAPRHIVISRNPRVKNLARAAAQLDKQTAKVVKIPAKTKRAKDRTKK